MSITGDYAANRGADVMNVFDGTATISSSGLNVFDITIMFTSSFIYDPTAGDLLVDLDTLSAQPGLPQFDAGSSSLVGRVWPRCLIGAMG